MIFNFISNDLISISIITKSNPSFTSHSSISIYTEPIPSTYLVDVSNEHWTSPMLSGPIKEENERVYSWRLRECLISLLFISG